MICGVESTRLGDHLCHDILAPIPFHAAPLTDDAPIALPCCREAFRAPAAAVGVDKTIGHLEDRNSRCIVIVPRARGIPFFTVHGDGISIGKETGRVERVNGHIQEQHVLHVITEATEVRADVEIAVYGC